MTEGTRLALRIGIDVGGTNTDAVLLDGLDVLASIKRPTTADVTAGIVDALGSIFEVWRDGQPHDVSAVMIGTTHFTNAIVQRRDLTRIALMRLCLPAGQAIPPLYDWPGDLRDEVMHSSYLLKGGLEFDGSPISELDPDEVDKAISRIVDDGLQSVAVIGTFSPVSPHQEAAVAEAFRSAAPGLDVCLSHEIGRLGALERENATALNACLADIARKTISAFEQALSASGLDARLYLSQNDGTLMNAARATRYPVLTFASGPTNSMRGASMLSGVREGIVLDIGGTTTDGGALTSGFPREASFEVEVGGVRTNFRMPDVVSIGLGGGSYVLDGGQHIGPQSVGYRLLDEALVFGGDTLTMTDAAVANGVCSLGNPEHVSGVSAGEADLAMRTAQSMLAELVDQLKLSAGDVPVVLVGGGATLFPMEIEGASTVTRPEHAGVANAIGAAIAQVSGEVDRVFSMEGQTRDAVMAAARAEAIEQAVASGARRESVEVVEVDELPLAYLPSHALRVRIKAVGDLDGN
jgi:N-methylhydantoinase A/oxoprolinase/acetone carboxylase beta subunit